MMPSNNTHGTGLVRGLHGSEAELGVRATLEVTPDAAVISISRQ